MTPYDMAYGNWVAFQHAVTAYRAQYSCQPVALEESLVNLVHEWPVFDPFADYERNACAKAVREAVYIEENRRFGNALDPWVYRLICYPTGRVYVGSTKCLPRRANTHFRWLDLNVHSNVRLQQDYNLFRASALNAFRFEGIRPLVLPSCGDHALRQRILKFAEAAWTWNLRCVVVGYNSDRDFKTLLSTAKRSFKLSDILV
jgi:hypothetical protein